MSETFDERISASVRKALSDPTLYPDEMKAWLPRYLEISPPALQLGDIQGLYTMSDTVAGLGAGINGRIGMIRAGSTPYEYLRLTYDSVLGKWLSDSQIAVSAGAQTSTTGASFGIVPQLAEPSTNLLVVNALQLYNSGLRPQIAWAASIAASANGNTVAVRPAIYEFNTGTNVYAAGTLLAHTTGMSYLMAGGVSSSSVQDWEDMTWDATPSKSHWYFTWELKVSAGTGYVYGPYSSFRLRWVT